MQEHNDLLEEWPSCLAELPGKRAELTSHVTADDIALLLAPEEGLRCQWEELCRKVANVWGVRAWPAELWAEQGNPVNDSSAQLLEMFCANFNMTARAGRVTLTGKKAFYCKPASLWQQIEGRCVF